ncbi:RNA polymerase sigma factor SigJ [Kitasatospora sp. NPDC085879]|uniref:RNA polymerase sigma factor SigJ n=1 Tax=Kitasatospora sp. NPDC085879 TaxID=3154769 RepID=UPI000BB11F09|nr:RNA polymerase sigma factor SigJ [Streptomyces sp. TLI_235]PBC71612.1 RNA polymerase sigma-70 factor (ECF subfamily) [Streptomyces sp. TLI_235]
MTDTAADGDGATQAFVDHRELLFSIVYSMLGTVADTEDVLQETWLAWAGRGTARIDNPRAYLVRIAVNKALARRAAVTRRRETYVGPWLPEPLVAPTAGAEPPAGTAEEVEQSESVSMALMVVLETLSPLERAVFVLHEVFGYRHDEIADLLGRTPAAVRQTAHRARAHVQARRPRYRTDARLRRRVTERFAAAVGGGDLNALLDLLAPDVTLWADGGGKAQAAGRHLVRGRDKVARTLLAGAARNAAHLHVRWASTNGDPSAVLFAGEQPFAVLVVEPTADGDHIHDIYFVTNPEKLTRVH